MAGAGEGETPSPFTHGRADPSPQHLDQGLAVARRRNGPVPLEDGLATGPVREGEHSAGRAENGNGEHRSRWRERAEVGKRTGGPVIGDQETGVKPAVSIFRTYACVRDTPGLGG